MLVSVQVASRADSAYLSIEEIAPRVTRSVFAERLEVPEAGHILVGGRREVCGPSESGMVGTCAEYKRKMRWGVSLTWTASSRVRS